MPNVIKKIKSISLTTDEGQSLKGNLDLIAAFLVSGNAELEHWTPQTVILVLFLLVRAFLGWATRGHEAVTPMMPEPEDEDEELPNLVSRGRK